MFRLFANTMLQHRHFNYGPSDLVIAKRDTKSRIAAAGTPRRRSPDKVSIRGSSQPSTWPSFTNWVNRRLESTAWERFSRENSYCCGRSGRLNRLQQPFIQRPVVGELQRAKRVGNPLNCIRLTVSKIIVGIDTPILPRAWMFHMQYSVQYRVAHVHIARSHVDLSTQYMGSVREIAPARI